MNGFKVSAEFSDAHRDIRKIGETDFFRFLAIHFFRFFRDACSQTFVSKEKRGEIGEPFLFSFGDFIKEANSTTEGETALTSQSQYGDRFLSVGGGNLVFQTDVDLATVMAKRYFSRYHLPKRRVNITARFMPEMELGDRVTFDVAIPRRIAQAFDARILGVAHDLMNFRTEFDLQEI
jgi:hypothetical protein